MRHTSWNAEGRVELAWKRLNVKNGRDTLAELTGFSKSKISGLNSGTLPMTPESAMKISEATGISARELGAPVAETDRLEALGAAVASLAEEVRAGFVDLRSWLEDQPAADGTQQPRRARGGTRE